MVYGIRRMGPIAQRVAVPCPECDGSGMKVRAQDACKKCRGNRTTQEKKRVEIYIERGMLPGSRIVVPNEGDESVCSLSSSSRR